MGDFSWENMQQEDLKTECINRGIPLPEKDSSEGLESSMRTRLRSVVRWEKLPVSQLKRACEMRYLDCEGKSREQLLEFLKSFKILPKPKPVPPEPPPAPPPKPKAAQHSWQHQQQQ